MRRLIFSLLSLYVIAQADTVLRERGPYLTFGRNLTWSGSGRGSINDVFVFTPLDPNQGVCIFVTNRDVNSKSFTMAVYQTGDSTVPQYTGYTERYRPDTVQGVYSPVSGLSTTSAYIHTTAAARVAVQISGGSGSGTADVYAVQTSAAGCGPIGGGSQTVAIQGDQGVVVRQVPSGNPYAFDLLTSVREYTTACVTNSVPTTLTTAWGVTAQLVTLAIANTTTTTINFTLRDASTPTPFSLFEAVPINGNSTVLFKPGILKLTGGIQWQASAAGLVGWFCVW